MEVFNINIAEWNYDDLLSYFKATIKNKGQCFISYVNVYIALLAQSDSSFRLLLNSNFTLYSDGIGMHFAKRMLNRTKNNILNRTVATDFNQKVIQLAENNNLGVFFFGGGKNAIFALEGQLKKSFPKLKISGILDREAYKSCSLQEELNNSKADILFVGLGSPLQEKWISTEGKKCNIPIQIAVGSGIDYLAGTYKRAPKPLQRMGLEWLFRVIIDPKRLWKRYLFGIPQFIYLIILQTIKNKIK